MSREHCPPFATQLVSGIRRCWLIRTDYHDQPDTKWVNVTRDKTMTIVDYAQEQDIVR